MEDACERRGGKMASILSPTDNAKASEACLDKQRPGRTGLCYFGFDENYMRRRRLDGSSSLSSSSSSSASALRSGTKQPAQPQKEDGEEAKNLERAKDKLAQLKELAQRAAKQKGHGGAATRKKNKEAVAASKQKLNRKLKVGKHSMLKRKTTTKAKTKTTQAADSASSSDVEEGRRTSTVGAYDTYTDRGWCGGGIDRYVGSTSTALTCWERCWNDYYQESLVSIDWWAYSGSCYCQVGR